MKRSISPKETKAQIRSPNCNFCNSTNTLAVIIYLVRHIIKYESLRQFLLMPLMVDQSTFNSYTISVSVTKLIKFQDHYKFVKQFIDRVDTDNLIIVGHDWGGVLGFWYAFNHQEKIRGIAFMETFPFTISIDDFPPDFAKLLQAFRNRVMLRTNSSPECIC